MTNVAARNEEMKLGALLALQQVFCTLVCLPLQEDINDIVVGMKGCPRNGVECKNRYCGHSSGHISPVGDSPERERSGKSRPESIGGVEESAGYAEADEGKQLPSDSPPVSLQKWRSSRVGDCGGVRGRVCELVSVIGENGGDVDGLESELTSLVMYQTL